MIQPLGARRTLTRAAGPSAEASDPLATRSQDEPALRHAHAAGAQPSRRAPGSAEPSATDTRSDAAPHDPPPILAGLNAVADPRPLQSEEESPAERERRGWFPALAHRNFRNFLVGQFVSVVGTWMQTAALAWYVQILTHDVGSEYWLGLLAALTALPIVVFSTAGGVVADRFSKRLVVMTTQAAAMLLAFAFGTLVLLDAAPFWSIFAFAAMTGVINAFDVPARQSFAIEMVGRTDLLNAIAINSSVFNAGRLLGPLAAGLAIWGSNAACDRLDWGANLPASADPGVAACFLINGLSFLGVIAALGLMRTGELHRSATKSAGAATGTFAGLTAGFRTVFASRHLLGLISTLGLVLLTGGTYVALLPALAQNELGLDEGGYSLLLAANGLGSLLGALAVTRIDSLAARRPAIVAGILAMALGLLACGSVRHPLVAGLSLVLAGFGFLLFLASTNSTVQLSVEDDVRGRVMSLWVLTFGWAQPIGSYLAGQIAHHFGTPLTLQLVGAATFLAALLAWRVLWKGQAATSMATAEQTPISTARAA
jgi:MFS family permease